MPDETGGGLDQNLSLKASMQDKVTPVLGKIKRYLNDTRKAFRGMTSESTQAESGVTGATGKMAQEVEEDLGRVRSGLENTGKSFDQFENRATQGSKKVGKSIQDAVYTQGADQRLGELDSDLGKLGKTFDSMASRNRTTSGAAASLKSSTRDNINKKVIPAFDELHSTLDKYPDTLEDINQLEQDRTKYLEDQDGALKRVATRLDDAGDRIGAAAEGIKFGMSDMVAAVQSGAVGAAGIRVQEGQVEAGRAAGTQAFQDAPAVLREAMKESRATMGTIQPLQTMMLELHATSNDTFPAIARDIVNIGEATGVAKDEIGALYDQLTNVAGIKGEGFLDVYDNVKFFAENSRASLTGIQEAVARASDDMILFSGEARKAFVTSTAASAAAARNMGMEGDVGTRVFKTLQNDVAALGKLQEMANIAGLKVNLSEMVSKGDVSGVQDVWAETGRRSFKNIDITRAETREAARAFGEGLYSLEDISRIKESKAVGARTGVETSAKAIMAQAAEGAPGSIAEGSLATRGTAMAELEQATAAVQSGLIEPGRQFAEAIARGTNVAGNSLQEFADALDNTKSHAIAVATVAQVGSLGVKGFAKALEQIPGVGEDIAAALDMGLVGKAGIAGATTALTARSQQDRNFELLGITEEDTGVRAENLRKTMSETDSFSNVTQAARETISLGGKPGEAVAAWLADDEKQRALEDSIAKAGKVAGSAVSGAWERTKDAAVGTANLTYDMVQGIGIVVPQIGQAMDLLESGAKRVKGIFVDEVAVPPTLAIDPEATGNTIRKTREELQADPAAVAANKHLMRGPEKDPQLDEQTGVLKRIADGIDGLRKDTAPKPETTQPVTTNFTVGQQRAASFEQKQTGRL